MSEGLHHDAVEIRHEPDGHLLAVFMSPEFKQADIVDAVRKLLKGSNNFSIRGIHTLETHISFDNNIKIMRYKKDD